MRRKIEIKIHKTEPGSIGNDIVESIIQDEERNLRKAVDALQTFNWVPLKRKELLMLNFGAKKPKQNKLCFVNLHGHSEYSTMDGVAKLPDILKTTEEKGMSAVAVTDHGTMAGILPFYLLARDTNIKPILGVEAYVDDERHDKGSRKSYHLVLLAKNMVGYRNICAIVSDAYKNGFYYRPRTTKAFMRNHSDGMIALSSCVGGEIPQVFIEKLKGTETMRTLPKNQMTEAKRLIEEYVDIFGHNFYLEIQFNEMYEQDIVNEAIFLLSEQTGVSLVATTDYHYVRPEDSELQRIQLKLKTNSDKFAMHSLGLFLKDGNEVYASACQYCKNIPDYVLREAIVRTCEIADQIDLKADFEQSLTHRHFPSFETGGVDKKDYLKDMCKQGFVKLIKAGWISKDQQSEYLKRLQYEFSVITELGFEEYFLVVADAIDWAKKQGIFLGPGRGSAAGCLLSWCLGITQIDPIKHGLLFERFLNKDRGDHPDIDVDFESTRRDEVIQYLATKYGEDCVAKIITHTRYGGRGAIQDLARFFFIPQFVVEKLNANLDPKDPSIAKWIEEDGEEKVLKEIAKAVKGRKYENEVLKPEVFLELALQFEEQIRQYGTHPGGVVVSSKPLSEILPLQRNKDVIVTAFDESPQFECLSKLGLIKIDILAIKTLNVIKDTIRSIKDILEVNLEDKIWQLPLDDPLVLSETSKGFTVGTFQFESDGIRRVLSKVGVDSFDDMVAVNALYRPGTIESGAIDRFAENKHNEHLQIYPDLKPILGRTYGVIVYQEQVIRLFSAIAGFTPTEADIARKKVIKLSSKSVGDKKQQAKRVDELTEIFEQFKQKAVERGHDEKWVDELLEQISAFSRYSFNVAHATSYTYVFYATQWLKLHYPEHYFKALLDWSNLDDRLRYIREAKRLGVAVLPPNINKSGENFQTEGKNIRYGLSEIKHIKSKAAAIIKERPHNSFLDLTKLMKGQALESLIDAGALGEFGSCQELKAEYNKKVIGYSYDDVEVLAVASHEKRLASDAKRLADGNKPFKAKTLDDWRAEKYKKLFNVSENSLIQILLREKGALGYYRQHPLALPEVQNWVREQNCVSRKRLEEETFGHLVIVVGVVEERGKKYGRQYLTISDPTGFIEIIMTSKFLSDHTEYFDLDSVGKGSIVLVSGTKVGDGKIILKTDGELSFKSRRRMRRTDHRSVPRCQIYEVTDNLIQEFG